jgi:glycosyltransferase 2 family protein
MMRILRWCISIILLIILFQSIDLPSIRSALEYTQIIPLLIALVMLFGDRFLFAIRWKMILKPYANNIRLSTLSQITFISTFMANLLPSALSADVVRTYFLHKEKANITAVISSIFLDRVIGFFALMVLSLVAIVIAYIQNLISEQWLILVLIMAFITFVSVVVGTSQQFAAIDSRLRNSRWSLLKYAGQSIQAIREYPWTRNRFLTIISFSCFVYLLAIYASYLIFLSIGGTLPIQYFFIFVLIVQLAISLPISIGGLGVHEGAWVVVLGSAGVNHSEAFLFALLLRVVGLIVSLPGGLLYAFYSPRISRLKPEHGDEPGQIPFQEGYNET